MFVAQLDPVRNSRTAGSFVNDEDVVAIQSIRDPNQLVYFILNAGQSICPESFHLPPSIESRWAVPGASLSLLIERPEYPVLSGWLHLLNLCSAHATVLV